MTLSYGSVCSGIEAASLAWEPLGMRPAWFSQFDPEHNYSRSLDFPSRVLAHHWPHISNVGDMTNIVGLLQLGAIAAPDILVGGTPCQAFSLAGLRGGLSDSRGQLTLEYVRILNELDKLRTVPAIGVWENVPGVLSSKDNAFGYFLAGLAGESKPLEPTGRKWSNAGYVSGPTRTVAWRVLDAQYFGVAQRRRRVFVVASARAGFCPAKVLFEFDGVRRDIAPSRETGSPVAALTANGVGTCGADDNQAQAGYLICMAHGQGGAEIKSDDSTPTLTCNHEAPIAAYGFQPRIARNGRGDMGDVCHTLSAQAGETGKCDSASCVVANTGVRRLTPVECERLQGFPDNHTNIPGAADGPRYKALGNSMAVPVMKFIGERILWTL